jgi:hypothetical protein
MADNIAITAGSGTTIATDDVSGVHYQRVKLVNGTLDANDAIPGEATNGLDVDVTRVPADPFGVNADAASATGSISAKLRQIAATGIPVTNASGGSAVNIQDGGNSITVDGSVTATLSAETTKVIGTINVAGSQTIATTNAGTFAVQDTQMLADSAGFTQGTSKVCPIGFLVDDTSTDLLSENDTGAARITTNRILLSYTGEPPSADTGTGGTKTDTTAQDIMAAAASLFNYLCFFSVHNTGATNSYVTLKDDTTVKAVIPVPAYGGAFIQFNRPIRNAVVNKAFTLTPGVAATTLHLYGGGYRAAV